MSNEQNVSRRDFLQRLSVVGIAGLGAGSLVSACGGGSGNGDGESGSSGSASESAGQSSGGSAAETVTLHPQGNQMKFKETEFTVPADTEIELVFENTASSPSMQHNVVILNTAPEQKYYKQIGQAGTSAGSTNDYVPEDSDIVLAHTPVAKPGETVSMTFTTPSETGDYGYVCTYPGHWATMNGTMHVK